MDLADIEVNVPIVSLSEKNSPSGGKSMASAWLEFVPVEAYREMFNAQQMFPSLIRRKFFRSMKLYVCKFFNGSTIQMVSALLSYSRSHTRQSV